MEGSGLEVAGNGGHETWTRRRSKASKSSRQRPTTRGQRHAVMRVGCRRGSFFEGCERAARGFAAGRREATPHARAETPNAANPRSGTRLQHAWSSRTGANRRSGENPHGRNATSVAWQPRPEGRLRTFRSGRARVERRRGVREPHGRPKLIRVLQLLSGRLEGEARCGGSRRRSHER